jgi:hypothetical protein
MTPQGEHRIVAALNKLDDNTNRAANSLWWLTGAAMCIMLIHMFMREDTRTISHCAPPGAEAPHH